MEGAARDTLFKIFADLEPRDILALRLSSKKLNEVATQSKSFTFHANSNKDIPSLLESRIKFKVLSIKRCSLPVPNFQDVLNRGVKRVEIKLLVIEQPAPDKIKERYAIEYEVVIIDSYVDLFDVMNLFPNMNSLEIYKDHSNYAYTYADALVSASHLGLKRIKMIDSLTPSYMALIEQIAVNLTHVELTMHQDQKAISDLLNNSNVVEAKIKMVGNRFYYNGDITIKSTSKLDRLIFMNTLKFYGQSTELLIYKEMSYIRLCRFKKAEVGLVGKAKILHLVLEEARGVEIRVKQYTAMDDVPFVDRLEILSFIPSATIYFEMTRNITVNETDIITTFDVFQQILLLPPKWTKFDWMVIDSHYVWLNAMQGLTKIFSDITRCKSFTYNGKKYINSVSALTQ
jgi:hypothetical protein